MTLTEFIAWHEPALAIDEVKHGLILNALARASGDSSTELSYWTLGGPGECAIMRAPHSIVLGALDEGQCRNLAELTAETNYPGVMGLELTAKWFTDRATELGACFHEPARMLIQSLTEPPRYPGASGYARTIEAQDALLFADWMVEFHREAIPRDPVPSKQYIEQAVTAADFLFWMDGGQPTAMAGIARPLKNSAAVTGVYTPPRFRGRGYAGSVVAASVARIFSDGRKIACLFTDQNNPISNRCYAKIGFRPVGEAMQFYRHA